MKIAVCLMVMSSVALAAPGDQCKAPAASSSDELTGTTYTWVKDDGGMAPGKGNVLRLDFYGGHADITATTGNGPPTVWTGTYSVSGGKITIHMDGEGISVDAKDQPYSKTGDTLVLPFGLVKGAKSTWHCSKEQIITRVVKGACTKKLECARPGGIGTHSFSKDCLFFDTTLDGALLDHEQLCVVDCDFNADPETLKCSACASGLEGKVAFSNFNGLEAATRTKLSKLYGDLVSSAQPDSYARCVAEAKLADATAAEEAMYRSGQKTTRAQEDAAGKAVSDARKALDALVDHPEKRKALEQQILDILLADMIPFQKVCKFDAAPSVKFKVMGAYSAPATPDTSCDPDDADLTSPTQLSRTGGGFEQQIFDSLFYSRNKKTGYIHADRYESAAAALVHEGFHHEQYNCGEGWASSDAARAMILELTEVMTYALSESVPFYKFMLNAQERDTWTTGGRRANMRAFERTWAGKRWCAKQNKEIPLDGSPPTDADRKWVASFAFAAYPWMQARMELDVADDDGLWIKLCNKTSPIKGVQCGNATRLKDVTDHKSENTCR